MRILHKSPNDYRPKVRHIDGTLASMQEAVGGHIKNVTLRPNLLLVCNDEGRLNGMPFNLRVCGHDIYGPFFFCRPEGEQMVGLSRDDAELLRDGLDWSEEITA